MDPIADMFSQINNAQNSGKNSLSIPFSKMKTAISEVLKKNNYIREYHELKSDKKAGPEPRVESSAREQSRGENNKLGEKETVRENQKVGDKHIKEIEIILNKDNNFKIQRISKPGRRVYASTTRIPKARSPQGMVIISTPEGLMVGEDARRKCLGGEVIAEII